MGFSVKGGGARSREKQETHPNNGLEVAKKNLHLPRMPNPPLGTNDIPNLKASLRMIFLFGPQVGYDCLFPGGSFSTM